MRRPELTPARSRSRRAHHADATRRRLIGGSRLSAYDAETGNQTWRIPAPTDTAQWQVTGPYLLLIDYTADFISRSITRYAP